MSMIQTIVCMVALEEQCRQYLHSPATFPGRNQPNQFFMANVSLGECVNNTKVRDLMQIIAVNFLPFYNPVGHQGGTSV